MIIYFDLRLPTPISDTFSFQYRLWDKSSFDIDPSWAYERSQKNVTIQHSRHKIVAVSKC